MKIFLAAAHEILPLRKLSTCLKADIQETVSRLKEKEKQVVGLMEQTSERISQHDVDTKKMVQDLQMTREKEVHQF